MKNEIVKGMSDHHFFKGFQPGYVELLSECASIRKFNAGSYIFRDGEAADQLLLIQAGKVTIELQMPGGRAMSILTIGEDGVVGWSWIVPPHRWHFSARAVEETTAIVLDANGIMRKCDENNQLGFELMKRCANVMGERLNATRAQLLSLSDC